MSVKKEHVDKAIVEFCKEIIKEPLLHFSESDLHVILMEKLYQIVPELKKKKHNTNVNRGKNSKTFYKTRLVHREYGGGGGRRIDIVIFDDEDIGKINTPNLTIDYDSNYLQPLYSFELGTEKSGLDNTERHAIKDIEKLKNSKDCGYLIHIFRDVTDFPSNTKERDDTEKELMKNFKDIFSKVNKTIPDNVKIIAILLSPFRSQIKTWGKCKIFNKKNLKWEPVGNLSVIENKLNIQLN
jgi:hypothetical protein